MSKHKYDCCGWATKNNVRCADGRTIKQNAFAHCDGKTVPLVWMHDHNSPTNVLGHALLENRPEGTYTYCTFNETEAGQAAKESVKHKDVTSFSIYANHLEQNGGDVIHGMIREVSLVLAGANPEALIESVIMHGEELNDEACMFFNEPLELVQETEELAHAEEEKPSMDENKTVQDVLDTLNEEQQTVVYGLLGELIPDEDEKGENTMAHNAFDQNDVNEGAVLSHDEMTAIFNEAKRTGSLKEATLAHGITDVEFLFPEARTMNNPPEFIKREMGWVSNVMGKVHKTPFSRIRSLFADITEDDARAKGYIKGKFKKEEVFTLLKRSTSPTTIYKKQKLHRDDVIDIVDYDVVSWLKGEMRMMLDEEIARAILIGDGRSTSDDDHINDTNIRPVWKDADLYSIKCEVTPADTTDDAKARAFIRSVIKQRKNYKGSGTPTLYTTEDMLTDCLLLEDKNGRIIYDSVAKLATTLRVAEIVTVPVMEGQFRKDDDGNKFDLLGIVVNLADYNVGADKGGAVNMFDDFDIDYNAQKYLIETRCSGALIKPFSAMVLEQKTAAAQVTDPEA